MKNNRRVLRKDIYGKDIYEGCIVSVLVDKYVDIERQRIGINHMTEEPVIINESIGKKHLLGESVYIILFEEWGMKYEGFLINHSSWDIADFYGYGNLFLHPDNKHNKMKIKLIGDVLEKPELLELITDPRIINKIAKLKSPGNTVPGPKP